MECIRNVTYKLQLPDNMKIHPIFHGSRLKAYKDPATFDPKQESCHRPPPVTIEDEEYEIDKILDKGEYHGRTQYLVHWLGYEESNNSWLYIEDLQHAQDLILDYE